MVAELEKSGLKKEKNGYEYLLSMPVSQLTAEEKQALEVRRDEMEKKTVELENKTSKDLWIDDLKEFRSAFLQVRCGVMT